MSNITKTTAIKQYSASASSHIKNTSASHPIRKIVTKGDAENEPNRSSNNQHFIIDDFYENVLNVKASYQRLYKDDDDRHFAKQFVRNHINELLQLFLDLSDDILDLFETAIGLDESYGTHYRFYLESILQAHQNSLEAIGCYFENRKFRFEKSKYIRIIQSQPDSLCFLFEDQNGLIDELLHFNAKIKSSSHGVNTSGNIIDYTT